MIAFCIHRMKKGPFPEHDRETNLFHISSLMPCIYHDERIVRSIENFIIV